MLHDGQQSVESVDLLANKDTERDHLLGFFINNSEGAWMWSLLVELWWKSRGDVAAEVLHDLIWSLASSGGGDSWLDHQKSLVEIIHSLLLESDVGVGVETEDLWVLINRPAIDVSFGFSESTCCWNDVGVKLGESIALVHDLRAEVSPKHSPNESDVLVVCHTTTIGSLGDQVIQSLIWNLLLLLDVHAELLLGSLKITSHPSVWDVPSNSAVLSPLEDGGMEVSEGEEQLLELLWFGAAFEFLLLDITVSTLHVGL